MMLIGESGNTEPICLRAINNASPIHRYSNVRLSDSFEWGIQIPMARADLSVSLKLLVQKTVIDRDHITTLQVRCDLVDRLERSLIEHRFINWPLDEYKFVALEAYQLLRCATNQTHWQRIQ